MTDEAYVCNHVHPGCGEYDARRLGLGAVASVPRLRCYPVPPGGFLPRGERVGGDPAMRLLATWLIVYATTTESKVLRYLATYVGYGPRVERSGNA